MDDTALVRAWLEANLGRVVWVERQPRWRPVWFADVEAPDGVLRVCVRGERTDMPLIFPLDHEARLQSVMHDHGIPTTTSTSWPGCTSSTSGPSCRRG
jgi:hypothetical protein